MRRSRVGIVTLAAAFALFSQAEANNINTGGQLGVVHCLTSKTLGLAAINLGGGFKYERDHDYVSDVVGATRTSSPNLFSGNIFINYGLLKFWDFGVMLPLYYDITGWDRTYAGVGDLELATKLAIPLANENAFFGQAIYGRLIVPTGSDDRGYFPRHAYYSTVGEAPFTSGQWLFNGVVAWSFYFDKLSPRVPLQLHANVGAVVTKQKDQSVVTAALALEYAPWKFMSFFVEVSGEARASYYTDRFSIRTFENDPILLSPGVRFTLPQGFWVTVAGDIGLSSQDDAYRTQWKPYETSYATAPVPRYGVQINAGWGRHFHHPDTDKDGILDALDDCPTQAEDFDKFQDSDGCPDPDNDSDGVADARDSCPNEAATCSGCPVRDGDNDGIVDSKDKCPKDAEDKDGFQDDDGCPEADNDKDGIIDNADKCPNVAEDKDGFEDIDGCPDLDNDKDGVADEWDKCPDIKGVASNNGCPKTEEIKRGGLVLKGVNFVSGKAVLTRNSFTILDMVCESLQEWPEVKLEIQGHTDNQGKAAANMKLSQERAESVRIYLLSKGVAANRLTAVGYGVTRPVADNKTAAGRETNRRVELLRND
jgi:outer membrane protein OmpA-like peptidoglycan-associated protein